MRRALAVEKLHGVTITSLRSFALAALAPLVPALALAEENAGPTPASTESGLWWMWIALAVLLVVAVVALFVTQEPRARAADRERGRRVIHGHGPHDPRTVER